MSQVSILGTGAFPTVATSYPTDSGTAIPAANVLNVLGNDTTVNDNDGLRTIGSGNTVTVQLTNRIQGTASTTGAVTADAITFALGATAGTFSFEVRVAGFEATTPASAGYSLFGTVRTTGAAATLVGTPDRIANEEAALTAAQADIVVSGNNVIVRVTGVAALTISWNAVGLYTFVGA